MATQATQTRPLSAYGMTVPLREVTSEALSLNARASLALLACSTCKARPDTPPKHAAAVDSLSNSPQPVLLTHPESTHDRAHVSIMRTCSDAWLKAGRLRTYTRKDQRGQREHHRAQPTPLPYAGRSAAHQLASEGTHSSSTRSWFCTRFETRTGA